ncbi:hypothetical protein, partial [Tateyamaria sp.]|uniref:hypothetical protein n=1 Tax=Tateyamaria sp. TaxID=1929288 RepID=UPI00329CCB04
LFYFTERVHYGTEFKIGVAYVDPFKVFQIPLIYSTPFSMICAMVLYIFVKKTPHHAPHSD